MSNSSNINFNNPYLSNVISNQDENSIMEFTPCMIELSNSDVIWGLTHFTVDGKCLVKDSVKMVESTYWEDDVPLVRYIPIINPNQDAIKRINETVIVTVDVMNETIIEKYNRILKAYDEQDEELETPNDKSNIVTFPKI